MSVHRPSAVRRLRAAVVALVASLSALTLFVSCDSLGDDGSADGERAVDSATPREPDAARPKSSARPAFRWDSSPDSIAAVGDSITRGFDACSVLRDCPEVSWVTGTDSSVPSLARRLLTEPKGSSWNLARSGALVEELPDQMRQAAARDPELVTVLIGANDACRPSVDTMTSVAEFRADFTEALRVLREEAPQAQVYVSSLPDLKRLWATGKNHPLASRVWQLGICQSMLDDPRSVTTQAMERRDRVQDRVMAYNKVLRQVCSQDERCRHDGGAVFKYRFSTDELSSWDWFHPSVRGQRKLAEIAYQQVTAAEQAR